MTRVRSQSSKSNQKDCESFRPTDPPKDGQPLPNRCGKQRTDLAACGAREQKHVMIRRGDKRRDIEIKFFILENKEHFEHLKDKSKMAHIVDMCDSYIQNWYFQNGVDGNLPEEWSQFKELLLDFATDMGLEGCLKYSEESWPEYVRRIKILADNKGLNDKDIFIKLRKVKAPIEYEMLFFTESLSVENLISKLEEWDSHRKGRVNVIRREEKISRAEDRVGVRDPKPSRGGYFTRRKCFSCNERGHIAKYCDKNTDVKNLHNSSGRESKESVKINDVDSYCVFDSGSMVNIITECGLSTIHGFERVSLKNPLKITFFNNTSIKVSEKVLLKVNYKDRVFKESFYIAKNGICDVIIGKDLMDKFTKELKFPLKCAIPTAPGKIVSWSRPIYSWSDREDFKKLVAELEEKGIVEKSRSPWLNPVILTRKKSGDLRFCLDYRRVNSLVELDEFNIPNIQELVRSLRGQAVFSIIDLKDGYFQVDLNEADKEKTAFLDAKNRLMQFTKMVQGYKNAPAIFQRGMQIVLEGLIGTCCFVYLDDILVFGQNGEEHNKNLDKVKEVIGKYNLKINYEKSQFNLEEVDFLGYRITKNTIKPTEKRSQGILDYEAPKTKKQLRRFLGIINYDRLFIKNLSTIAKPLYGVAGNPEKKLLWTEELDKCFKEVKKTWAAEIELKMPDNSKQFELETDASDSGIGAVLRQSGEPICYISRLLKGPERNYGITEREFLASLWAMEKLQFYLLGRKFILLTDHKPLEEMLIKKDFGSKKIHRWMERLSLFDFDVKYIKGSSLLQADALSRVGERGEDYENLERRVLEFHCKNGHRKGIKEDFEAETGLKVSEDKIRKILKGCEKCAKNDKSSYKSAKFVHVERPGDIFAIDLMDINKEFKIIIGIDYFSRKVFGRLLGSKDSMGVLKFLKDVYGEFEFKTLQSDNGKEFANSLLRRWCEEIGVMQKFTTPHYHQENGRVERAIRTIRDSIRRTPGSLKTKLSKIIEAYNRSKHRGLGMSPDDALKEENWEKIKVTEEKYKKEFKSRDLAGFKKGDLVLLKNHNKESKMDEEYKEKAKVVEACGSDVYIVENSRNKVLRRHGSQMRVWPGDVGKNNTSYQNKAE